MMNALLQALRDLGGSASISELEERTAALLKLSESDLNEIHRRNRTKFSYRLAWTRNYLKRYGLVDNSVRGIWALTELGSKTASVNPKEVKKAVRQRDGVLMEEEDEISFEDVDSLKTWKEDLIDEILSLSPSAFERLCQRLLRESGFIQVEVTGRTGDGGVDGKGVVQLGGLLSFHVIYQAKRYKGSIGASIVRDFRGAMVGRADKGLIITTGTFTRDARAEAQRDGAPPIDLIDGDLLGDKLRQLSLGVKTESKTIETSRVEKQWFSSLEISAD
jgi:restriction system protein